MSRILAFFIAIWLGGFGAAAATAPDVAPAAFITGSVGMLLTLAYVAVRVSTDEPSTRHRAASMRR